MVDVHYIKARITETYLTKCIQCAINQRHDFSTVNWHAQGRRYWYAIFQHRPLTDEAIVTPYNEFAYTGHTERTPPLRE
jgi:hypothetical protein